MDTWKVGLVTAASVTLFFSLLFASPIQHPAWAGTVVVVPHAAVVHTAPTRPYVHPHAHGSRATTSTYWWWPWSSPQPCKKTKNGKCRS
jgi:hypothetical protein